MINMIAHRDAENSPSIVLDSILGNCETQSITIGSILASTKQQGFGLLLTLLALPILVPLPPGLGAIPGSLLILWSFQRLLGRPYPWIPQRLQTLVVSKKVARSLKQKGIPVCKKLEAFCGKRPGNREPYEWETRLASLMVVLMGLLIILPTPFLNTIPAFATVLVGISSLYKNRWLLWISIIVGLVSFVLIGSTIFIGGEFLIDEIQEALDVIRPMA